MTHRLVTAAVVTAAAALGLTATAQAATVELKSDGTVTVRAAAGENNNLHVAPQGVPGVKLRDFGAKLTTRGSGCSVVGLEVVCPTGVARVDIALGDGNDLYAGQQGFATVVDAGPGNDQYFHDGKTGVTTTRTDFRGGAGDDTASYGPATAGVIVTKDGVANDGRTLNGTFVIDRDNIRPDVERLLGSPHNDSLNGSSVAPFPGKLVEQFIGGAGNDVMTGGPGEDFFDMSSAADGADIVRGGGSTAVIDAVGYGARVKPVVATIGHGIRDDGEAGEADDVTGVERVFGGRGDDIISQVPGTSIGLQIFAGPGNDTLTGAGGADFMNGDAGIDTYSSGAGADTIFAAHGDRDTIDCGSNPLTQFDRATTDASETSVRNCENSSVGRQVKR